MSEAMEEDPPNMEDPQSEDQKSKTEADKEKQSGNAAYKKKHFDEAIQHYTRALELWDKDISFLTNRAGTFYNCAFQIGASQRLHSYQSIL